MDFQQINNIVNDIQILPGINDLVNVLYNDELNKFLDKRNETRDDKRVLLMFLVMYFYSFLSIPKEVKDNVDIKQCLKAFLSDIIKDQHKRTRCLEMYKTFESTVETLMYCDANQIKQD